MSQSLRISLILQQLANEIDATLRHAAGERVAFVLVVSADDVSQYIANCKRPDGVALIESLLQRWKTGKADIPAHYNPDLPRSTDH